MPKKTAEVIFLVGMVLIGVVAIARPRGAGVLALVAAATTGLAVRGERAYHAVTSR
jgi:hypothetical protein